jgi:hypothetical protein
MPLWRLAPKNFVNLPKIRIAPREESDPQNTDLCPDLRLQRQNKNLYDKDPKNPVITAEQGTKIQAGLVTSSETVTASVSRSEASDMTKDTFDGWVKAVRKSIP